MAPMANSAALIILLPIWNRDCQPLRAVSPFDSTFPRGVAVMRHFIIAAAFAGILAGTAAHADTMKNCGAAWTAMSAADKAKTTYKAYSAMCLKSGYTVPATVASNPPAGATGQC